MKDNFDNPTRKIVVQSLVLSVLNYGLNIRGATNIIQIERVKKSKILQPKWPSVVLRKETCYSLLKGPEMVESKSPV